MWKNRDVYLFLIGLFIVITGFYASVGARLPACSANRLEIDETATTVITCDELVADDGVGWIYLGTNLGICAPDGSCSRGSATVTFNNTKHRLSTTVSGESTHSNMSISPTKFMREISARKVHCGNPYDYTSCLLDVVHPAEVLHTSCKLEVNRETWNIEGSCDITKVFSSMGYYKCQVYTGTSMSSQPNLIADRRYEVFPLANPEYNTGSCSFNETISNLITQDTATQNLYFRFTVYPGSTQVVKGPVAIERPVTPIMKCPDIVRVGIPFSCTCSTTSLGRPPGRLYWSRDDAIQQEGAYGATTLTAAVLPVTRSDNNQTKLSCGIRWAVDIVDSVYSPDVGIPALRPVLTVNSKPSTSPVTVNESSNLSFTCSAAGGIPTPTLTLYNAQSAPLANGSSLLTHSFGQAQCQHSGRYACKAMNSFGNDVTDTTLYVNCKPRFEGNLVELNFANDPASIAFDVTAYPAPDRVTFAFLGSEPTKVVTPLPLPSDIRLKGTCEQKTSAVYVSTCTVTVAVDDVTATDAVGSYRVTVINDVGHQDLLLHVRYKAGNKDRTYEPVHFFVAIGVLLTLLLIMIAVSIIFVLWLWRHQWKMPCSDSGRRKPNSIANVTTQTSPPPRIAPPVQLPAAAEDHHSISKGITGPYDELRPIDIGLQSVYSQITNPSYVDASSNADAARVTQPDGDHEYLEMI